jgi:CBS domain-containing protein
MGGFAMVVKNILRTDYVNVKETDSIEYVLDLMSNMKINSLPVENPDGLLTGIVVKADIYRFMIQPGHYDTCPVSWVMSREIISVSPYESVRNAARKILENHIIAMPVVQDGKACGMLFIEDLLDYYLRSEKTTP